MVMPDWEILPRTALSSSGVFHEMTHQTDFARSRLPLHARLLAVIGAMALVGCGGAKPNADSQVAAQVNRGEISVHQVQSVLNRQTRRLAEQPETAARKVLDSLVEQELAAQAARAEGLDNDPAVVQALQVAQREVLARAYQDRLARAAVGPTSDDVDRYYDSQPALFSQRRLYTLQEFAVEAAPAQFERIGELARQATSAAEVAELLRADGARFDTRQFVQAAEDLPLGLLGPMAKLSVGQSHVVAQPGGVRVFTVLHAQLAPVDRRRASDAIAAFLRTERRREQVVQGMKSLRTTARIEYQGSFAQAPAVATSAPEMK